MNLFFLGKILVSASIIALASDLARKSAFAAAITLALPLTSLLALLWVHYEADDSQRLIDLSWGVFWLVPPSLAFFLAFATLIGRQVPFWIAFALSAALTVVVYIAYAKAMAFFGVKL